MNSATARVEVARILPYAIHVSLQGTSAILQADLPLRK